VAFGVASFINNSSSYDVKAFASVSVIALVPVFIYLYFNVVSSLVERYVIPLIVSAVSTCFIMLAIYNSTEKYHMKEASSVVFYLLWGFCLYYFILMVLEFIIPRINIKKLKSVKGGFVKLTSWIKGRFKETGRNNERESEQNDDIKIKKRSYIKDSHILGYLILLMFCLAILYILTYFIYTSGVIIKLSDSSISEKRVTFNRNK